MEETQNNPQVSGVSFPNVNQPQKPNGSKMFLIVGILVLVGILGFVIYRTASSRSTEVLPTPDAFENFTTPSSESIIPTFTPAPVASASSTTKIDKTKVQIQVQNGTGISGEAAYLQSQLGLLGYTNIKIGNSSSTVTATTVTFSKSLDTSVVSEITQKLNLTYQTVNVQTSSTATFDVVVVAGLRKGTTPKSSSTPSPTPSSSASPKASLKASPTASPKN
jgi:hypothetical protein